MKLTIWSSRSKSSKKPAGTSGPSDPYVPWPALKEGERQRQILYRAESSWLLLGVQQGFDFKQSIGDVRASKEGKE